MQPMNVWQAAMTMAATAAPVITKYTCHTQIQQLHLTVCAYVA